METSWQQALDDYLCGMNRAPKTVAYHKCQVRQLAAWASEQSILVGDFRAKHMRLYMEERAKTVSEQTREHDGVVAKQFCRFLKQEGYSDVDALREYTVRHAPEAHVPTPTSEQVATLLKAIQTRRDPKSNPAARTMDKDLRLYLKRRDYALVCLLVDSAARIGEILSLTMENVNLDAGTVTFPKTKGRRPRTVPIKSSVEALRVWIVLRDRKQHLRATNHLFFTQHGEPINPCAFERIFVCYVQYAGLPHFTLHSLRHYALGKIAQTNFGDAVAIAGHKDPRTTLRYARADPEHMRETHDKADPLGKALVHKRGQEAQKRKRII